MCGSFRMRSINLYLGQSIHLDYLPVSFVAYQQYDIIPCNVDICKVRQAQMIEEQSSQAQSNKECNID